MNNLKKTFSFKNFSFKTLMCALLVVAVSFAVVGCSKKAMTGDEFKSVAESKGFTVNSDTAPALDKATKSFVAAKDNTSVYFWEFANAEDAQTAYDTLFNQSQGSDDEAPGAVLEGSNFKKYTFESVEDYSLLSRVDNTLILGACDLDEKETLKSVTEELGY